MSDKPSYSRIRIALAQFLFMNKVDIEELYGCLGIPADQCEDSALAHMAGLIDGINLASARIKQYGIDDWAKANT